MPQESSTGTYWGAAGLCFGSPMSGWGAAPSGALACGLSGPAPGPARLPHPGARGFAVVWLVRWRFLVTVETQELLRLNISNNDYTEDRDQRCKDNRSNNLLRPIKAVAVDNNYRRVIRWSICIRCNKPRPTFNQPTEHRATGSPEFLSYYSAKWVSQSTHAAACFDSA